jgi:hypothetical protein
VHAHLPISTISLLAAHTASVQQYWHKITDRTFTGIYHANFFDLAMMVPYFIVLFVLAIYGMHRYWLVYDYYAYAKNVPGPPPAATHWPRVTVQLPIFNERYVIERLVEAISRFDYPRELLDIQVLDDSTDETQQVASARPSVACPDRKHMYVHPCKDIPDIAACLGNLTGRGGAPR